MKNVRRWFRLQNVVRSRNDDPERMPLNATRDRTPSSESVSTNSSSGSSSCSRPSRREHRTYGTLLPAYFTFFRNTLRRSRSSQVREISQCCGGRQMTRGISIRFKWKLNRIIEMLLHTIGLNKRLRHLLIFIDCSQYPLFLSLNGFIPFSTLTLWWIVLFTNLFLWPNECEQWANATAFQLNHKLKTI